LLFITISLSAYSQADKSCDTIELYYISRMPEFFIEGCQYSEYYTKTFSYYDLSNKYIEKELSGSYRWIIYNKLEDESKKISGVQILQNYTNAVKKAKGECLSVNNDFFKLSRNGKDVYIKIEDALGIDDRGFSVYILEVEAMRQDLVISLDEAIEREGKAAVYGILFDVGKSVIKPESENALKQITEYLNANPSVKIIVVGHTDNSGSYEGNMTLSKARAESIKSYLITNSKISASRLLYEGVGQVCPIASNATEEGRKKNRRVEIVKQ